MVDPREKDEKILQFCDFIIRFIASQGEERLTAAVVSRGIGVSRAWIYKYFGSKKSDWLRVAAEGVGEMLALESYISTVHDKSAAMASWKESAERFLSLIEKKPWIGMIYFRYMGKANHPIGKAIQKVESRYLERSYQNFAVVWNLKPAAAKKAALAFLYYRMMMAHAWVEKGPQRHQFSRDEWLQMLMPRPILQ